MELLKWVLIATTLQPYAYMSRTVQKGVKNSGISFPLYEANRTYYVTINFIHQ